MVNAHVVKLLTQAKTLCGQSLSQDVVKQVSGIQLELAAIASQSVDFDRKPTEFEDLFISWIYGRETMTVTEFAARIANRKEE